jgi:hypothetical protein
MTIDRDDAFAFALDHGGLRGRAGYRDAVSVEARELKSWVRSVRAA